MRRFGRKISKFSLSWRRYDGGDCPKCGGDVHEERSISWVNMEMKCLNCDHHYRRLFNFVTGKSYTVDLI